MAQEKNTELKKELSINYEPQGRDILLNHVDLEKTKGGILLPEGVEGKHKLLETNFEVIAIGKNQDMYKIGDKVLLRDILKPIYVHLNGSTYMQIRDHEIAGKFLDNE